MGLPNFYNYYLASHLTRVIDWHCHAESKDWVILENSLHQIQLKFSPWTSWREHCPSLKNHPLTGTTLSLFHNIAKNTELTSNISPLTPLMNNPDFPPGLKNSILQAPGHKQPPIAKNCFDKSQIKDFTTLKKDNELTRLPLWS